MAYRRPSRPERRTANGPWGQSGVSLEGKRGSHWQQSQYKVLVRWLKEIKPVLVVVDSLTSVSTLIAAKENEAEYAHTLYRLARENGDKFPATTFLWNHHNTKDGLKFRGTDLLRNAVRETWELKALTDEQRVEFGGSRCAAPPPDARRHPRAAEGRILEQLGRLAIAIAIEGTQFHSALQQAIDRSASPAFTARLPADPPDAGNRPGV